LSCLRRWRETVGIFFHFVRALWPALPTPLDGVISGAITQTSEEEEKERDGKKADEKTDEMVSFPQIVSSIHANFYLFNILN